MASTWVASEIVKSNFIGTATLSGIASYSTTPFEFIFIPLAHKRLWLSLECRFNVDIYMDNFELPICVRPQRERWLVSSFSSVRSKVNRNLQCRVINQNWLLVLADEERECRHAFEVTKEHSQCCAREWILCFE